MAIKDLQAKQGNVNIEVDVVEKGDVREFQKFGKPGRVCTAIVKDETGECKLSLWNEQIDQVNAGDKVRVSNGYVSEWQGELQLTAGRMGSLEVIGKGSADDTAKEESSPVAEAGEQASTEEEMTEDEKTEEETLEKPPKKDTGEHILTDDEAVEEEVIEEDEEEE